MTVVKKYAGSQFDSSGQWVNPENTTGEHDTNCGSVVYAMDEDGYKGQYLTFSDFGFNIPSDAVIDSVKFGGHMIVGRLFGVYCWGKVEFTHKGITQSVLATVLDASPACADSTDKETEHIASFSPDDLNNEVFTFRAYSWKEPETEGFVWFLVDCVWIEVEYHVPPPAKKKFVRLIRQHPQSHL